MKNVLDCMRKLHWDAGVDTLVFLSTVISLLSIVSASQTSGTCDCDQYCPKTRELVTTVWGGAVTLFVLSLDSLVVAKIIVNDDEVWIFCSPLVILCPFFYIFRLVHWAVKSYDISRRMPEFTLWSWLPPWTKNTAKILCGCDVIVTVPTTISIPEEFVDNVVPINLAEALVVGCGEESLNTQNIHFNADGFYEHNNLNEGSCTQYCKYMS